MTKDEVAEAVRAWCDAYDTHDIDTIVEMEASSLGFGFRTAAPRARGRIGREQLERFFSGVDYYRLTLESLETDTNGDVGLAWGVFIEHFQHKGQPPERARVRFSNVMTNAGAGWQILLYHRDIQPFDEEGRYPKTLTAISRSDGAGLLSLVRPLASPQVLESPWQRQGRHFASSLIGEGPWRG